MCKQKEPEAPLLFETETGDLLGLERKLWSHGYEAVAGLDEAGRGPLAGPVVAAAVVLGVEFDIGEVNDSKKLSAKKRLGLYIKIIREARYCAIGAANAREIEEINILQASLLAMKRALDRIPVVADYILVDGNQKIPVQTRQRTIVGGDGKSVSIAAASILAKVARDFVMEAYDKCWPVYEFSKNKGYATAKHIRMLESYGPCPVHRKTFRKVKEHCQR